MQQKLTSAYQLLSLEKRNIMDKKYHLRKCERETIIIINDAETSVSLSTSQEWMKRRIRKLAESHPDDVTYREDDGGYIMFASMPKKYIRISPPRKMTEEQRLKAAERMRSFHKKKESDAETDNDGFMDEEDVEDIDVDNADEEDEDDASDEQDSLDA